MSKYIINLSDDCNMVQQICIAENCNVYIKAEYAENLEELNSDYINEHFGDLQDTAYQKGFEDGKKFSVGEAVKRAEYDKGLEDAWECVKKLYLNGMSKELFGRYFNAFIQEYSARQAIEMLKAHEQKKVDKIEVGDEVVGTAGHRGVVTKLINDESVYVMWEDGSCGANDLMDLKKTVRTRHDIEKILEAMKA